MASSKNKSPSSSLCCTGWQQTLYCNGHGPLDLNSNFLQESTHGSHKCNIPLSSQVSGVCTCKDGSKKYFDCGELGGPSQPSNCDEACKGVSCIPKPPVAPSVMYSCNNYTCSTDSSGKFPSLEDCQKDCTAAYQCNTSVDGFPICEQVNPTLGRIPNSVSNEIKGNLSDLEEEVTQINSKIQKQVESRNSNLFKGNLDGVTKNSSAIVKSQKDLIGVTSQIYELENKLKMGENNSKFKTLSDCQASCQPRFTCDENTWTVKADPNGKYARAQEASLECKEPIIIPKQKVTQEEIDREKEMSLNIQGDLHSGNSRLKSTEMHFFVWTSIAILFVGLIVFYITNNRNNVIMSVIGIVFAILFLYIIALWIYKYFFRSGRLTFGINKY